jgi:beta-RFAP synthase
MLINKSQVNPHVFVNAFARLHMGFLDLNGSLGRRFGGLGLGLEAPDTLIELAIGNNVFGDVVEADYVSRNKHLILAHVNVEQAVSIKVHREIPRHFGLGSGTQMALATGVGINQLFELNLDLAEIAYVTGRGLRSGIGIGTFANGGLVLDGGRTTRTKTPPIITQQHLPEAWRVLLIFDYNHVGVHGDEEVKAFANLEDANLQETQKISHQILMRALPALQEFDLNVFGEAVALLQAYTGDYFAPVQDGRFASQEVTKVLHFLSENGMPCVGQSSWGPTGFAIFESESSANDSLLRLNSQFKQQKNLKFMLTKAANKGASVIVK